MIIIKIYIIILLYCFYLLYRNNRAAEYMHKINNRGINHFNKLLNGLSIKGKYYKLLFSFKSLKDKYWIK